MIKRVIALMLIGMSIGMVGCGNHDSLESANANVQSQVEEKSEDEVEKTIRISSSTVAATQVMDRLGLELVGVPQTSTVLPDRYKEVQAVGQAMAPNFEVITSVNPDLVVIDNNFKSSLDAKVKEFGFDAFYFNTSTFNNFKSSILELGKLTSKEKKAAELTEELQASVDSVLAKGKKADKSPRVLLLFGTSQSYMLATDLSYVGDLLNTIGIDNIADEIQGVDSAYVNYSMEQVVALNPDYVLRLAHGDIEASKKAFEKEFSENPAWLSLDATKEGRVYDLDPSIFGVSANLRITEAITKLGEMLYGN